MQTINFYISNWYKDKYPIPNGISEEELELINNSNFETLSHFNYFLSTELNSVKFSELFMKMNCSENENSIIYSSIDIKIIFSKEITDKSFIPFTPKVHYSDLNLKNLEKYKKFKNKFIFINLHESLDTNNNIDFFKELNHEYLTISNDFTSNENNIHFPYFLLNALDNCIEIEKKSPSKIYLNKFEDIDREYKFLSLNKNCSRNHRIEFIYWLWKKKYLNKGLVSAIWHSNQKKYPIDFLNMFPLEIDTNGNFDLCHNPQNNFGNLYKNSYFSIVTETNFYGTNTFLTEKIFKPIYNSHLFIPISNYKTMEYLNKMGFINYDDIRYDFDLITKEEIRFNSVIDEIERLINKTPEELKKLVLLNKEKIEHNLNNLKKFDWKTEIDKVFKNKQFYV